MIKMKTKLEWGYGKAHCKMGREPNSQVSTLHSDTLPLLTAILQHFKKEGNKPQNPKTQTLSLPLPLPVPSYAWLREINFPSPFTSLISSRIWFRREAWRLSPMARLLRNGFSMKRFLFPPQVFHFFICETRKFFFLNIVTFCLVTRKV